MSRAEVGGGLGGYVADLLRAGAASSIYSESEIVASSSRKYAFAEKRLAQTRAGAGVRGK